MTLIDKAINHVASRLTDQLARTPAPQIHHQGVVAATGTTGGRASLTLTIGAGAGAVNVAGVFHDAGYTPTIADVVIFVYMGKTPWVTGKST